MNRKERVLFILMVLQELFPEPQIPLKHKDPYTLLVAVLLSAHTTDVQVNKVTPALFALADTPEKMMQLSEEEILHAIRSCGLAPTKAKAIKALSQILVRKHQGKVPSSLPALEALPGVGHKTASVVLIQAFHKSAFPVDTHIHRLAKRWGLSTGKNVRKTETDLKALFPKKLWSIIHLQMILFARRYCPARGHIKENCPICSHFNVN